LTHPKEEENFICSFFFGANVGGHEILDELAEELCGLYIPYNFPFHSKPSEENDTKRAKKEKKKEKTISYVLSM